MQRRALVLFVTLCSVSTAAARQYGLTLAAEDNQIIAGDGKSHDVPGSVYIYDSGGGGRWTEVDRLVASDASGVADAFGIAVAVDAGTMIVGASRSGRAYIFSRKPDGKWVEEAILDGDGVRFGRAVAIHGSTALVAGATPSMGSGPGERGETVHVYERSPDGSWAPAGQIASTDLTGGTGFGAVMELSSDRAAISAPGTQHGAGLVYVYRRSMERGEWKLEARIVPPVQRSGNRFGTALLLKDDILTVGSPGYSLSTGAVFLYWYHQPSSTWYLQSQLSAFSARRNAGFGASMALDGDRMWIGAPGYNGGRNPGSVFEFEIDMVSLKVSASRLTTVPELPESSLYGTSLAAGKGTVAIGSPGYDNEEGVVFAVSRSGDKWAISAPLENDIFAFESSGGSMKACEGGTAGNFPCKDVDMLSFLSVRDMGAERGIGTNDLWGWEDPETGREYAIVGFYNQTSFVDVTDPYHPIFLGDLDMPDSARMGPWRDIKVYQNHAYIVSDAAGKHGIQIFDLRQLRDITNPPVKFNETAHYSLIFSAHNIVINEETGYAYVVGGSTGGETCGGGLHMIDLKDPANPTFTGCFTDGVSGRSGTGYTHDAQCVIYHGPDVDYQGHEICIGSNETAISIVDVTDKDNPIGIALVTYPAIGYAHQGWLTEDHRYFYLGDELDETQGLVENTRTLIWDFEDLDEPELAGEYLAETTATDHNLFIKGHLMYQSNNAAGLRILDISDPEKPIEIAYFDTSPVGRRGNSWSNYPYFKSGIIVVTGGKYGLFVLQKKDVDI